MADTDRFSVLESRGAPGIFLAMGWAVSTAELAWVLNAWAVGHSAVTVVSSGAEADVLRREIPAASGWTWVVPENVTEDERIAAARKVFRADGWILSSEGATAWAAAAKLRNVRLVIDFSSPRLPLRLPAGTRVGGIIIPQ